MISGISVEIDRKQARQGKEVVIFADKSCLVLLYYCKEHGLYFITRHCASRHESCLSLDWLGVKYLIHDVVGLATLTEETPEYNWREVYRAVRRSNWRLTGVE